MYRSYVMICGGPNCTLLAGRQEKLAEEFEVQLKLAGLRKEVQVMRGGCLGLCSSGPNVAVFPEGTIYSHVHVEDVAEIVSEHLLKGGRVDRLLYNENEATSTVTQPGGDRVLQEAAAHCPAQLRRHRPPEH